MLKPDGVFHLERDVDEDGLVIGDVLVAGSLRALESYNWSTVCLKDFHKAFGFTPRKGKRYKVTVRDAVVEEIPNE